MTRNRSTSFWNEAALRVQRGGIGAPLSESGTPSTLPIAPAPDPAAAQERCDAIQAEFHAESTPRSIRRDPPPLPAALIATDDALSLRLAEELDYARRMLDQMGDALTADSTVLMRHGVAIQSIDVVGQILGHIAAIVRSSDPAGAVEHIGMADLKGRLKRSSIG